METFEDSALEEKYCESWERPEKTEFMAGIMDVDKKEAFRARWRYLRDKRDALSMSDNPIIQHWLKEVEAKMKEIEERAVMKPPVRLCENPNEVSEDMVMRAKEVPIDSIVDFKHGKALAWCHDDNRPSLYHGTRRNIAVCPVCDKKFDTIGVLMERDGFTFQEAVNHLCIL